MYNLWIRSICRAYWAWRGMGVREASMGLVGCRLRDDLFMHVRVWANLIVFMLFATKVCTILIY